MLRLLIFVLVPLAAITALVLWVSSFSEPEYKGVKLSVWHERYNNEVDAEPQRKEAAEAIQQIGSNAVPTLIKWLGASDSKLKLKLRELTEKQSIINFKVTPAIEYHKRALTSFELLGQRAKSAIPELEKLLYHSESTQDAAIILSWFDADAIPVFARALTTTNGTVKGKVAFAMYERYYDEEFGGGYDDPKALLPIPLLLRLLHNTDEPAHGLAILQIGVAAHLGMIQPAIAVPLLVKELKTSRSEYLIETSTALRIIGPDARDAIPALLGILAGVSKTADRARGLYALASLRALKAKPSDVVPLLEQCLNSADADIRLWAIDSLKKYGPDAKTAIPAILDAVATDVTLHDAATRALNSISLETAEKAIDDGIIRGPRTGKRIALVFTAHTFAEGGDTILRELAKHHAKASFFVTGDFLDNPKFQSLAKRIVREGHYLGPHSDKHLLYCPWDGPMKTLVTREDFESDLNRNLDKIVRLGVPRQKITYWLPAYEWYNREIVDWSKAMGLTLVNYTPGTRANADYLEDTAKNFISSKTIIESIEKKEQTDPNGLNGFLLLMHLGVGPARTDKLYDHLGELLDYLTGKGYEFVRVDELLHTK